MRLHALVALLASLFSCARGGANRPIGTGGSPPDAGTVTEAPAGDCAADAKHCCKEDGTVVVPGGCQPSYPPNVETATERGPDGRCVRIECYLKCLPGETKIRTADGERTVDTLAAGDLVWTADCDGKEQLAPLVEVSFTPAQASDQVVLVTLADGRTVRASPGHPTAGGAALDTLHVGKVLDGSRVVSLERVPLLGDGTYDILPAGATGSYWAEGVLMGSTLAPSTCVGE